MRDDYSLRVISEINSPIHGPLLITTNPLLGVNIITPNKIAQSGDTMKKIWKPAMDYIKETKRSVGNALILGYGGGSVASLIHTYWSSVAITGIEKDPMMVRLGLKYLDLPQKDNIIFCDAYKFKTNQVYDLVLMDLFINHQIPKKFTSKEFIKKLSLWTADSGLLIVNLIDLPSNKTSNKVFKNILSVTFKRTKALKFQKNILIFLTKHI